jgi:propanol-preferring alcohol dehydrogenase
MRTIAPKDTITIGADPSYFSFRNLKVIGSLVGTMQDTAMALEYAQRGMLKQICDVRGLSQLPESVQQLRRGEVAGRVVIDFNKP